MKVAEFKDVRSWLEALRGGEPVGIMSTSLAAQSIEQACGWEGETVGSLSKKLKEGQIGYVRINGKRYISAEAIVLMIERGDDQFNHAYRKLEGLAERGQKTTYGEIMGALGMSSNNPPDRKRIGYLLGRVSRRSWEKDGIFLSSLVHRKGADPTHPGPGYLGLVEAVDPAEPQRYQSEAEMVSAHMNAVWRHYQKP